MAKSRNKHEQHTKSKREQARAIAKQFEVKQLSIRQKFGVTVTEKKKAATNTKGSKQRMKLCIRRRTLPRKFGISFTIPDRMATEINDKKRISGLHPLRITRIPSGGPMEFHAIVKEAQKVSSPLKNQQQGKPPNPKAQYHRSRFNDWHPQVFHFISDIIHPENV